MEITVNGVGDWGVLSGNSLSLFLSRDQAMAYIGWLFSLGLRAELWAVA